MKSRIFLCHIILLAKSISTRNHMFGKFPKCHFLNQTCDCWLITPNQQTLCTETNILTAANYKSMSGQLQNNIANSAVSITTNCVINIF